MRAARCEGRDGLCARQQGAEQRWLQSSGGYRAEVAAEQEARVGEPSGDATWHSRASQKESIPSQQLITRDYIRRAEIEILRLGSRLVHPSLAHAFGGLAQLGLALGDELVALGYGARFSRVGLESGLQ